MWVTQLVHPSFSSLENSLQLAPPYVTVAGARATVKPSCPQVLATLNTLVCSLTAQARLPNVATVQRAIAATVDRWLFRC
jgi:hypothetical protein